MELRGVKEQMISIKRKSDLPYQLINNSTIHDIFPLDLLYFQSLHRRRKQVKNHRNRVTVPTACL